MTKSILFLALLILSISAFGQQPFEEYGYKVKVATLSQGKYTEFFDQDSIVQIGSIILNANTGKVLYFIEYDTAYSEANLQPDLTSRWMSPDPLSEKYFSFSPYNYVLNNPIVFTDPDGRDVNLGNLYDKDDKGKYKYAAQILAFELFAKTKSGQQFLKDRAQKGFEFKAAFVKSASFTAKEEGTLSGKIDANFKVTNLDTYEKTKGGLGEDGLTEAEVTDNGKLSVTYHIDDGRSELKDPLSDSGYDILNKTDTYLHEVFLHGASKEENFLAGNYKKVGPIPPSGGAEHKSDFVQKSPYYQKAFPVLKAVNSSLKLNYTDEQIWRKFIFHGYSK